jgi:hypothetical protein
MIKNFELLADRLKGITINGKEITAEELLTNISSETEFEISVPKINLMTDDELKTAKTGYFEKEGGTKFVDGMRSGVEQLVKTFRNKRGLDFEGKIKFDGEGKIDFDATAGLVADNFETKILADAKIEPDKQIKDLQGKIEKIQSTYDIEKSKWEDGKKGYDKKIKELNQDYFLQTNLPNVEGLSKKQLSVLFKADGFNVDFDENGQPFPTQFGKRITDKMEKNIPFEGFALQYIDENKFSKKAPGKGGKDDVPPASQKFKTKNEAFAYMEKEKIDPTSFNGQQILSDIGKE